ncbi:hypothetical protein [Bacillus thuringiensis]|uniref:hypothetical protein n=1 Tax=Bacillus thuringiensis TaxID=1428 RepID=UPI002FBD496B
MAEIDLHIRHFILANDFDIDFNASTFTAIDIYEYISASQYPSYFNLKGMLGICFLTPHKPYKIEVDIMQEDESLGKWVFNDVITNKENDIMNINLNTDGRLNILHEGFIHFVVKVNDQVVGTQVVKVVREEV